MNTEEKDYLTPREVAERLRLSLRSTYRLLAEGKIVGVRRGKRGHWMVSPAAADAFLESPETTTPVPPTREAQRAHEAALAELRAAGYPVGT